MAKKAPFKHREALALRIKSVRQGNGYSQAAIAELLGLTEAAVRGWESGVAEPPLAYIDFLVTNFNCAVEWLLFGQGEPLKTKGLTAVNEADRIEPIQINLEALDQWKDKYLAILEENRELRIENERLRAAEFRGPNGAPAVPPLGGAASGAPIGRKA